jgi:hypothetical protein
MSVTQAEVEDRAPRALYVAHVEALGGWPPGCDLALIAAALTELVCYGVTWVIRVAQFARAVLVPPQEPNGADMKVASEQLCAMYSCANQMLVPFATAAP